jgi:hypothetical protein
VRYQTLVGIMAALGLLAGAVFAVLNPPVFTSNASVLVTGMPCHYGAICGGPAFVLDDIPAGLLQAWPSGVQLKPVTDRVLLVTATAATAARAEAAANAAARAYIAYIGSPGNPDGMTSAQMLDPATIPTGTAPPRRLLADVLLGVLFGVVLGVIAALAGSRTTIDPLAAPQGPDIGEEDGGAGQETGYASAGLSLQQLAQEHARQKAAEP